MNTVVLNSDDYLPIETADFVVEVTAAQAGLFDLSRIDQSDGTDDPLLSLSYRTQFKPAAVVTHKVGPQYYLLDPTRPYGVRAAECQRLVAPVPESLMTEPTAAIDPPAKAAGILNYRAPLGIIPSTYDKPRRLREGYYEPLDAETTMFAKNPAGTPLYDFSGGLLGNMPHIGKLLPVNERISVAGTVTAPDGTMVYVPTEAWGNYRNIGHINSRQGYLKDDLSSVYIQPPREPEPEPEPQPEPQVAVAEPDEPAEDAGTYQVLRTVWAVNLKTMRPYRQVPKGATITISQWVPRGKAEYGRMHPMYFGYDKSVWVGIAEIDPTTGNFNLAPIEHGEPMDQDTQHEGDWFDKSLDRGIAALRRTSQVAGRIIDSVFPPKHKQ